ncbi:MAG: UDP-N-acetylmuramoyl-L-alanine--D-glutamate ligase, partial [Mucispirillum sp.]|nr:UDP-N-acetylmuramoyl-L-alanine--D-glutamate ligase [Mucispirillum sp.]
MKAAIIGYGKSGAAAEKLLRLKGFANIDIFDDKAEQYANIAEYKNEYDLTCVSPGIDLNKYTNISGNITSEIELACEIMNKNAKIIAITGTNGKSTTTHLTAQIINNAGKKAVECGNIGYPYGMAVLEQGADVYVIELSSFQIELLKNFNAVSGCIINVTQDHLDRYGTMEKYYAAKLMLLNFIDKNGLFVTNTDEIIKAEVIKHNTAAKYIDNDLAVYPKYLGSILDFGKFSADTSKFKLFGKHNLINLSYALTMADKVCDFKGDVSYLLENLTSMPHRTELTAEINGIKWINDSKATNVDSVYTALQSIEKPSVLLIGGRDKKSDYKPLVD